MYVFYPETLYWVSTNVYLIISYPVPQQRTVHWDDHQTVRNKSLQKRHLRWGFMDYVVNLRDWLASSF